MRFQVDTPQKMNDVIVANFDVLTNRSTKLIAALLFTTSRHVSFLWVISLLLTNSQPATPTSLDSLLVSPHQCPVSQSKGRESKGATYQVDYQGVLLWLIKMECAHNEGC